MKCPLGVGYSGNRITLHSIDYVVHKQPVKRDFLVQTFGLLATPLDTRLWTLHEVLSSSNDESLHPLPQRQPRYGRSSHICPGINRKDIIGLVESSTLTHTSIVPKFDHY